MTEPYTDDFATQARSLQKKDDQNTLHLPTNVRNMHDRSIHAKGGVYTVRALFSLRVCMKKLRNSTCATRHNCPLCRTALENEETVHEWECINILTRLLGDSEFLEIVRQLLL